MTIKLVQPKAIVGNRVMVLNTRRGPRDEDGVWEPGTVSFIEARVYGFKLSWSYSVRLDRVTPSKKWMDQEDGLNSIWIWSGSDGIKNIK
jgi:hypothetical protein